MSKSRKDRKKSKNKPPHEGSPTRLFTAWHELEELEELAYASAEDPAYERLVAKASEASAAFDDRVASLVRNGTLESMLSKIPYPPNQVEVEAFLDRVATAHHSMGYSGVNKKGGEVFLRCALVAVQMTADLNTLKKMDRVQFSRMAKVTGWIPKESNVMVLEPISLEAAYNLALSPTARWDMVESFVQNNGMSIDTSIFAPFIDTTKDNGETIPGVVLKGSASATKENGTAHLVQRVVPMIVFCLADDDIFALGETPEDINADQEDVLVDKMMEGWSKKVREYFTSLRGTALVGPPSMFSEAINQCIADRIIVPAQIIQKQRFAHLRNIPEHNITELSVHLKDETDEVVDVYARFEDGEVVHLPKILPTVFVPRLIEEMDCPVQWNLGNSTIAWPSEREEDVQKDIECFDLDAMSKKTTSHTKKPR